MAKVNGRYSKTRFFCQIVDFDWDVGPWIYSNNINPSPVSVSNDQGTNLSITFKNHTQEVQDVGACQVQNVSQNNQVMGIIDKAK